MKGKFITFEGTEGVGKSTQARMLGEYLERTGQTHVVTREPGGDVIAEKIRNIVLHAVDYEVTDETEALLYAAARAQHVKLTILPNLEQGKIVVCDRFVDSSIVYQGFGRQLPLEFVNGINAYALDNCTPDATVLLMMDTESAFLRKGGVDKGDRLEISGDAFFERVQKGYEYLSSQKERIILINPLGSKWETHELILSALREKGLIK